MLNIQFSGLRQIVIHHKLISMRKIFTLLFPVSGFLLFWHNPLIRHKEYVRDVYLKKPLVTDSVVVIGNCFGKHSTSLWLRARLLILQKP